MEPSEVAARIKAARLLRGISQQELARRLVDAGLPWRLAGALERGELEMRPVQRMALAQALGFPERWFTDEVDDLCRPVPDLQAMEAFEELVLRLDRIEALLRDRG